MRQKESWFDNKPTYKALLSTLQEQIDMCNNKAKIVIQLNTKYSHKCIKQVSRYLGYSLNTKKPGEKFILFKL